MCIKLFAEGRANNIIHNYYSFSQGFPIPPRPSTPHPTAVGPLGPRPDPNIPTPPNSPRSLTSINVTGALALGIILSFFCLGWWYNDIVVWVSESFAGFCPSTPKDLVYLNSFAPVTFQIASPAFSSLT